MPVLRFRMLVSSKLDRLNGAIVAALVVDDDEDEASTEYGSSCIMSFSIPLILVFLPISLDESG
jgi:hypothetical protein